jgi:hypothetical protein
MKNYIEEFYDENRYGNDENDDENEFDIIDGIRVVKTKNEKEDNLNQTNVKKFFSKNKKSDFDEDAFDIQRAIEIVKIHNQQKEKIKNSWIKKNYGHLNQLYLISKLKISPDEFYTYIYNHSKN